MTPHHRALLEPHAEHFRAMASHVSGRSDEELQALLEACEAATDTNCAWDEYAAAQVLKKEIRTVMNLRGRRTQTAETP